MKTFFCSLALRLPLTLTLVLFGCGDSSTHDNTELSNIYYQQAFTHFSNGQYHTASIEAKNALQQNPQNIDAFVLTANILNTVGQYQQAIDFLKRITEQPEHEGYKQQLTKAYMGRKKYFSALAVLDSSESVNSTLSPELKLLVARCYLGQGRVDEAQSLYENIIEQAPNKALAYAGLVEIHMIQGNDDLAMNTLITGREIAKSSFDLILIAAQIKMASRDFEDAEELLTDAFLQLKDSDTMTPQKANTLNLLADVLIKQGRSAEALIYTRILADAFPGYEIASSAYEEAEAFAKEGKSEKAIAILDRILEDNPNFERASTLLAVLKFVQGDFDTASDYLNKTIDAEVAHPELTRIAAFSNIKTKNPQAIVDLLKGYPQLNTDSKLLGIYGNALLATGQFEQANEALSKSLALDASNVHTRLTYAAYYNELMQPNSALKHLEAAYTNASDNRLIPAALARQYVALNQLQKAEQLIEDQIKRFNRDSISHELAGDFYQYSEKFEQAILHYQDSLAKDPNNDRAALKLTTILIRKNASGDQIYSAFDQAIAANPSNASIFEQMLAYSHRTDSIDRAVRTLNSAVKNHNTTIGNAIAAIFFARLQNLPEAQNYRKKLDNQSIDTNILNKVDEVILFAQAISSLKNGDATNARAQAYAGLKLAPKSIQLMKVIADIEVSQSNYVEAEKIVNQITAVDRLIGMQLSGDLNAQMGNTAKAIDHYQSAWKENPHEALAAKLYLQLAQININAKNDFLQEWKIALPESLGALEAESQILLSSNRYVDSIPIMEKLKNAAPNNITNLNNLAWSYLQVGDDRALDVAAQAFSLAGSNPSVADTYGWILYKSGSKKKALEVLEKALSIAPDNPEIQAHLDQVKNG